MAGPIAGSIVVGDTIVGVGGGIDGLVVVGTWNPRRQEGNPTKSEPVNQIIKKVKRKEGRKEGAPSRVTRIYKCSEVVLFNRGCLRKKLVVAVKFLLPHTPATVACEQLEEVYAFDGRKTSCLRDIGKELKMTPRLPRYFARYPLN